MQESTGAHALCGDVARAFAGLLLTTVATVVSAGGVSITSGGSPAYSVPIAVPPGIAGMAPTLALTYVGSGLNGPLGYGWSLQATSLIARCQGSVSSSGRALPVAFATTDRLCLDGQRLIETNSSGAPTAASPSANAALPDAAGRAEDGSYTEYRTEKDSFARIRAYGMANGATANGPRYFKVWTKSGQIMEFGAGPSSDANSNALISASGQTVAVAWAVSRVSDTVGNYMDFKYNVRSVAWGSGKTAGTPTSGNEWNLVEIQYTGHAGTPSQAPTNKIVFEYADRPDTPGSAQDRSEAYHQGSKTVSVQFLKAIRTYVNWPGPALGVTPSPGGALIVPPSGAVLVKTTRVNYATGTNTGRSVSTSIQECAGSAGTSCMPATGFSYKPGATAAYAPSANFASGMGTTPLAAADGSMGVLVADFNGDGRSDVLRWSNDPTQNKLYTSNGDGSFTLSTVFNLTATNNQLFGPNACYYSIVADFNGDGFPDILRYAATTGAGGAACASPGTSILYLNNGNGSFTPTALVGVNLQRTISTSSATCGGGDHIVCTTTWTGGANFYLLDVDGDGKLDIVTSRMRAGSSKAASGSVGAPTYTETCPSSICTHVYKGDGTGHFTDITPASMQAQTIFMNPTNAYTVSEPAHIADINGDGLFDIVAMANAAQGPLGGTSWLSNGDGSFTQVAATALCNYPIDFNGDGRMDCLTPGSDPSKNTLAVSDGSSTSPIVANFNLISTGQDLAGTTVGVVTADIDNDGRTDLIRWEDDPTKNVAYLSNGDGTFRASSAFNLNTAAYALKKSDGTRDFITGDFTGNGSVEILRMVASPVAGSAATTNQLFLKTDAAPPEQLSAITTGSGIVHNLGWVTLPNSSSGAIGARFTPAPATGYPLVNVIPPIWVVATVESGTGIGGNTVKTEYAYSGLRVGLDGRGLLGFMKVSEQHLAPDNSLTRLETSYMQDRGYLGSAGVVQSFDAGLGAGGHLLSETTNSYCDTTSTATLPAIATYGVAPTPCATSALVQRPYLYQTVSEGWDIDGGRTALPVTTVTNIFDGEGNPTTIATSTSGLVAGTARTSTKTVTNSFAGENTSGDHWVLNRLQGTTVRNTVSNNLASVTTSAGSAAHATDSGGPTPGPNIPALMSIITELLLSD